MKTGKLMLKISFIALLSQSSAATATFFRPTWSDLITLSFPNTDEAPLSILLGKRSIEFSIIEEMFNVYMTLKI